MNLNLSFLFIVVSVVWVGEVTLGSSLGLELKVVVVVMVLAVPNNKSLAFRRSAAFVWIWTKGSMEQAAHVATLQVSLQLKLTAELLILIFFCFNFVSCTFE